MEITKKQWSDYISRMSNIQGKAGELVRAWIRTNGTEDRQALISYANSVIMHYGEASAELACQMYDAQAEGQGFLFDPSEQAPLPSYGEVAKAVNGSLKQGEDMVSRATERLVKQMGADTTLRNARRDRAQFAWVPSGDTCAFCLTLASRGWQNMSKKAKDGDHAEHIHANCDCQYAIRFDGKSTVAGYDPDKYLDMYEEAEGDTPQEKVNAMRRSMAAGKNTNGQNYRKANGAGNEVSFGSELQSTIKAKKVEGYERVFISEKAKIKPKDLHKINQNTEKAMKEWGIPADRKPTIIIVSDEEMPRAYGAYDAISNTVRYVPFVLNEEITEIPAGNIERHEMWHLKQAENFRAKGHEIIDKKSYQDYLNDARKIAKRKLDAAGVAGYNIYEISDYAWQKYLVGEYDETEAEYLVKVGREGAKGWF